MTSLGEGSLFNVLSAKNLNLGKKHTLLQSFHPMDILVPSEPVFIKTNSLFYFLCDKVDDMSLKGHGPPAFNAVVLDFSYRK